MKMTIEIECTPVEARQFMGLPDVTQLNDMVVAEMSERIQANLQMMSPEGMMRSWMHLGGQAQDAFMKMLTAGTAGALRQGE